VKRSERTRILIQGSPHVRCELAQQIVDAYDVFTIAEPSPGLVMMTMRETARKSKFNLGEVLVTEAKVQIQGRLGLGLIAGEDEEAAYQLAVIDAAYNASLPETVRWQEVLRSEAVAIESRDRSEEARILETRVAFQTMDAD